MTKYKYAVHVCLYMLVYVHIMALSACILEIQVEILNVLLCMYAYVFTPKLSQPRLAGCMCT
jgi:hypothetical protein